jgi:hypothetical protein
MYVCTDCDHTITAADQVDELPYRIYINGPQFRTLVSNSNTPKKLIKMMLIKVYCHQDWHPLDVDFYLKQLLNTGELHIMSDSDL